MSVLEGSNRSPDFAGSTRQQDVPPEEPLELRRYWGALRRSWLLMAFIVVPMTTLVLVLSLTLPKTYRASARIVLEDIPGLQSDNVESLQRRLATLQTLLTTREVLAEASQRLRGENADSLEDKVSASVDPNANVINVAATDDSANGAAAIANAVATEFLAKRRRAERQRLARARAALVQALNRLQSSPTSAARVQEQGLRERLSELSVNEASIGSDLQLAQLARPPSKPSSPKPVRNTVFAFLAASFLAVLAALARGQFTPRISGPKELGRLAGLPILAGIPRRRFGADAESPGERDAYHTLQVAVRMRLAGPRQQVVLVTSSLPDEGKTEVTAQLGRELAQAGHKTLVVSADLRRPMLHELFGVAAAPGLSDILDARSQGGRIPASQVISTVPAFLNDRKNGLAILPSGSRVPNPSALLTGNGLDRVLEDIKRADYRFVIVDGPPLLATVDAQALAMRVRNLLLVVRLDRVTPENVLDARDLLRGLNALGLVVMGTDTPTYY